MTPSAALTPSAREALRAIARAALEAAVRGESWTRPERLPAEIERGGGVFVTLKKRGRLRGCIGRVISTEPLWRVVAEMAHASALEDPRFDSMREDELPEVDVEISVLGPMRAVSDPHQVRVGEDGLWIRKQGLSGLLLPQVAEEAGWNAERFVGETCMKAGLPRDAWREDAEIYAFTAEVF